MGDRASCHLTIGGKLTSDEFEELCHHIDAYDLRVEWDGEPFTAECLEPGTPIELFGQELNGGLVDDLEAFCLERKLHYRRWSGGCPGSFLPEILVSHGDGATYDTSASEDEYIVFTTEDIKRAESLDVLKAEIEKFQPDIPAFELSRCTTSGPCVGSSGDPASCRPQASSTQGATRSSASATLAPASSSSGTTI